MTAEKHPIPELSAARAAEVEPWLAVVIPVWRAKFLGAALDSLRAQTDGGFRVYVGDDASPDDVAGVVARHGAGMDVTYHRFPENLGGRDLVGQWERCIGLTRGEPWIWVFADDDEAEPGCVAGWRRLVRSRPEARFCRLNLVIIDERGRELRATPTRPEEETGEEFLFGLLGLKGREVRGADHLFRRDLWEEAGGCVNFERALFADFATWIEFTGVAGRVFTLSDGRLRWRLHPGCTSGMGDAESQASMWRAMVEFVGWLGELRRRRPGQVSARGREKIVKFITNLCWAFPRQATWAEARSLGGAMQRLGPGFAWTRGAQIWGIWIAHGMRRQVRYWPGRQIFCQWRLRRSLKATP